MIQIVMLTHLLQTNYDKTKAKVATLDEKLLSLLDRIQQLVFTSSYDFQGVKMVSEIINENS